MADAESLGGKTVVVRIGFDCGICLLEIVGVGTTILLPLLQISFLPDFLQVKIIPFAFDVTPALLHLEPGITFATAEFTLVPNTKKSVNRIASRRFIH